jgi:hypothetical protein
VFCAEDLLWEGGRFCLVGVPKVLGGPFSNDREGKGGGIDLGGGHATHCHTDLAGGSWGEDGSDEPTGVQGCAFLVMAVLGREQASTLNSGGLELISSLSQSWALHCQ